MPIRRFSKSRTDPTVGLSLRGPKPSANAFGEWLSVGLISWVVVLILVFGHATAGWDNLIYDQLLRLHSRTPFDKIVIVAIDDPSLAALGAWPWPRGLHAKLLDRLTRAGAAAVGYDVLLLEPDPTHGDAEFAAALKKSGRTALPVLASAPGDDGRAVKLVQPIQPLATAAAQFGHVNLVTDSDGVARRYSEIEGWAGTCWPHLTLAMLQIAGLPSGTGAACAPLAIASRHVDALLASKPRLIPFAGPPGVFRTLSAVDVIRGEAPPELLKDRLVLVGATAAGLGDRHMTAGSAGRGAMPGVEIQANLLDATLQGVRLYGVSPWVVALASLIPVSAFMISLLLVRPSANMMAGVGLLMATFALSAMIFFAGAWLPPLAAAGGLFVAYPLWSWRRLAAASDYLRQEIARFEQPAYVSGRRFPNDTLGRQVGALSRAADHLRDLSRLFEDALQSLPDAAVLIDHDGVITLANSRAARLAGQADSKALIGLKIGTWLASAIGGPEADTVMGVLATTTPSTEITSARGADYEVSQAALINASGGEAGAILRLADITTVRSAMRQREQALQFLTHDIRSPLSSIVALVQTNTESSDEGSSAKIEAYAHRALALAEGYVQFARAESYRFQPETFDISQVVLDAADEIWPQASRKSIRIDADHIEPDQMISGDRSLVARALVNTLDNAVKYSPPDTVVTLSLKAVAGFVVCTIEDEGPGMSQASVTTLFEAFQRGAAGRLSPTGAGLGLAFVHTVMQRHGGSVACASGLAGGCRFELTFPAPSPV